MYWPTEVGSYTARAWQPRQYQKRHATFGAIVAARQFYEWKCLQSVGCYIMVRARKRPVSRWERFVVAVVDWLARWGERITPR